MPIKSGGFYKDKSSLDFFMQRNLQKFKRNNYLRLIHPNKQAEYLLCLTYDYKFLLIMKKVLLLALIINFIHPMAHTQELSDTTLIDKHLVALTKTKGFRSYRDLRTLNNAAQYIYNHFEKYADTVYFQEFDVDGKIYKNVVCSFKGENEKAIIVGAHYDVCGNQEGADDNASGVVGLLELARMLKGKKLKNRIEIVAYTLEEPPFFKTHQMGSYVHAASLDENKTKVLGMVCLEMIGYFDDAPNSQEYPVKFLSIIYGKKGDYITLVNKFGKGRFARKFNRKFKKQKLIKTKKFTGPKILPGVDFSDHLNYWKFGYSAVMITDTSFYRNPNYHETTDKIDTLNIPKMAKVIDSVFVAITN